MAHRQDVIPLAPDGEEKRTNMAMKNIKDIPFFNFRLDVPPFSQQQIETSHV